MLPKVKSILFYFFYRKVYFLKNNIIRNSQFLISLGQSLNIELFLLTDPRCFQYNGPDAECCTEDLLLKEAFSLHYYQCYLYHNRDYKNSYNLM